MKNLINWKMIEELSLYQQLKQKLEEQKQIAISEISEEDMEEELDYIEEDFDLFAQKLGYFNKKSFNNQDKFLRTLVEIDLLSNFNDFQKLTMMLSYGVLNEDIKEINERTNEEVFMIAASTSKIEIDEYPIYAWVLIDKDVSMGLVNSGAFSTQVEVACDIMDAIDHFECDYVEYPSKALEVINNYNKGNTK